MAPGGNPSTDTLTVTRGYRSTTAEAHGSGNTWLKWNDKLLHLSSAPPSGYLRLTYQERPDSLSSTTDTLEYTAGLPAEAATPLVMYACWRLLMRIIPDRIRNDYVSRAAGQYVISPNQVMQGAQVYKMLMDSHLNRQRMRPVGNRWTL